MITILIILLLIGICGTMLLELIQILGPWILGALAVLTIIGVIIKAADIAMWLSDALVSVIERFV